MGPRSRREYREAVHLRYERASRKEKAVVEEKGRPSRYDTPAVLAPLTRIRLAAILPCPRRPKAVLPLNVFLCAPTDQR